MYKESSISYLNLRLAGFNDPPLNCYKQQEMQIFLILCSTKQSSQNLANHSETNHANVLLWLSVAVFGFDCLEPIEVHYLFTYLLSL